MTTAHERTPAPVRHLPSLDWRRWRLDKERLTAALCVLAFAAALLTGGHGPSRVVGGLLVVETALLSLPWGLPRDQRSAASFWAESCVGLITPVGAVAAAVLGGAPWITRGAAWWWYPVAVGAGAGLMLAGGMNLRALVTGELAFVLGPAPRSHARARMMCAAVGPVGEEAAFRGTVLAALPAATGALGLLGAVAFVARHHVPSGSNGRGSTRSLLAEAGASTVLLLITLAPGSVYPALLAHMVNNVPPVVLEFQREEPEGA